MLTSLSLKNFKSWSTIDDMRLAPITGLFGPNSSGKSCILQFLLMLKQTVESPDRMQVLNFGDESSAISLGTFRDVIRGHKSSNCLEWNLSWKLGKELEVRDPTKRPTKGQPPLFSGKSMSFGAEICESSAGRISVRKFSYGLDGHRFGMKQKAENEGKYDLVAQPKDFQFTRTKGRAWPLPHPVKCYGFPNQVKAYFQNAGFLADLELAFEQLLASVFYLGPLRDHPKRQYTWAGAQPSDMGPRGERVVDALLASLQTGETISRGRRKPKWSVEQYVAWWLRELGLIDSFSVEAIDRESRLYRVLVQKAVTSPKVLITDVGFGVSQILPVLTICYYVPPGSTILLEQPEIHLHPSVQAGLADVFIDAVQTRKVQIIVESHSEYLLYRLQRRIAEETIVPETAALYFCEVDEGMSKLNKLELDLFGRITNWPSDFWGDQFGEMAAIEEARMQRKRDAR